MKATQKATVTGTSGDGKQVLIQYLNEDRLKTINNLSVAIVQVARALNRKHYCSKLHSDWN